MANNDIIIDDILAGLNAVISVNVIDPSFTSQAKTKLSGAEVEEAIYKALVREFTKFISSMDKSDKETLTKKIIDNSRIRKAADVAKATKRKSLINKSPANLPSKLKECDKVGDELSELYICEGDSAAGTIIAARDATFQAVLPVRGKVLNIMKMDLSDKKQMARFNENAEINDMIKALGAGIGQHFDPDKARYGKVIFAADADIDGMAINTLLLGIFYKIFRPMIEEGRVYQCVTPLFEIKYRKNGKEIVDYVMNERERMDLEAKLKKDKIKYKIDRNKGLGEMDATAFHEYVLNPKNRKLVKITVGDAERSDQMIKLAIGYESSADDRKEWMVDNSDVIDDLGLYQ